MTAKTRKRVDWIMQRATRLAAFHIMADQDVTDDFVKEFPEAEKTLQVYFVGPNSCPMFNRMCRLAAKEGLLKSGSIGVAVEGRGWKTWARIWRITETGWIYVMDKFPEQALATYRICPSGHSFEQYRPKVKRKLK
jgi:hypothetical protein